MASILVIGVGNMLMGDDGLGVHALQRLEGRGLYGAETLELGTSLADCFSEIERYDHLVALDAVVAGGAPGSLYWLSREAFVRVRSDRLTLHDDDLLAALDLAAMRGYRPVLHVAGMEPESWRSWSLQLSESVERSMPAYLEFICAHVRSLAESRIEGSVDGL